MGPAPQPRAARWRRWARRACGSKSTAAAAVTPQVAGRGCPRTCVPAAHAALVWATAQVWRSASGSGSEAAGTEEWWASALAQIVSGQLLPAVRDPMEIPQAVWPRVESEAWGSPPGIAKKVFHGYSAAASKGSLVVPARPEKNPLPAAVVSPAPARAAARSRPRRPRPARARASWLPHRGLALGCPYWLRPMKCVHRQPCAGSRQQPAVAVALAALGQGPPAAARERGARGPARSAST
mmetsp:Transcript_122274/g.356921  ORF Transcript_122274/g.356921 Transcript_122274/m.356921 type:complete len:239 (-) Transcript_122274:143-859(-)